MVSCPRLYLGRLLRHENSSATSEKRDREESLTLEYLIELLDFLPDIGKSLFDAIKKAETANVSLVWEDSQTIVKVSITHKAFVTSVTRGRVKK